MISEQKAEASNLGFGNLLQAHRGRRISCRRRHISVTRTGTSFLEISTLDRADHLTHNGTISEILSSQPAQEESMGSLAPKNSHAILVTVAILLGPAVTPERNGGKMAEEALDEGGVALTRDG